MHTDPIADLLTRLRNAVHANHLETKAPYSKIKENILQILKQNEYIKNYQVQTEGSIKTFLISLNPQKRNINFFRVSKPGQRIYKKAFSVKRIKNGFGIAIYSTTQGIVTDKEARKLGFGGEILCEVY